MNKGIIITHIPRNCDECDYCEFIDTSIMELSNKKLYCGVLNPTQYFSQEDAETKKIKECPIKPLPERGDIINWDNEFTCEYAKGYNAALNDIIGEN